MGLFKHLYFDIGSLIPFRKKKDKGEKYNHKTNPIVSKVDSKRQLVIPRPENKSLPEVSKRLLHGHKVTEPKPINHVLPAVKRNYQTEEDIEASSNSDVSTIKNANVENTSFFEKLNAHINREEAYVNSEMPRELLYKNLFSEMQLFWNDKKSDINRQMLNSALKNNLSKKIEELHDLEIEWQRLQIQSEKIKEDLQSKELLIENRIQYLKKSFKKLHLSTDIKHDHHFVLSNGGRLKNLSELKESLKLMDDSVFNYHVNSMKNDFSSWVRDVMGLEDLAKDLLKSNDKEEMHDIIENWYSNY